MQVQLNTDANVQGRDSLAAWAARALNARLRRFRRRITRVEVHLSDANAARAGRDDKRCVLEARLAGRRPVVVTHDAGNVADAVHGAADKLVRALDTALGRAQRVRGRDPQAGRARALIGPDLPRTAGRPRRAPR
ncbi:MAG: HPF/RaiA family ribosome-associated protein [Burkholderiales bacterium]|nr:HPF/RaiA family ribosome-associated protein [Burkholderiales bacterium]